MITYLGIFRISSQAEWV